MILIPGIIQVRGFLSMDIQSVFIHFKEDLIPIGISVSICEWAN
jgi:hypothetical protein